METMYSIGEISKIVKISKDTFRYYDEIGLLKPCYTDPETKYRFYSEGQVMEILKILELKQCGFSLDVIKSIMQNKEQEIKDVFSIKRHELLEQKKVIDKSIRMLNTKIKTSMREENQMNKTVLTIDDAVIMNKMLKEILETNGFNVIAQALDGNEGIEQFQRSNPDLVTMDIVMPNMSGEEALKEILLIQPDAKVIMLTALAKPHLVLQCLLEGASGYVVKPFRAETLVAALNQALNVTLPLNKETIARLMEHEQIQKSSVKENIFVSQEVIDRLIEACCKDDVPDFLDFL